MIRAEHPPLQSKWNVLKNAKKLALKRCIGGGEKGLIIDDLVAAVRAEFKGNEDLPNTSNPND